MIVANRNHMNIDEMFKEIEPCVKKLRLNNFTKVIVTEEIGYKVEEVELFIGYLQKNIMVKLIDKIHKCEGLTLFNYPTVIIWQPLM